MFTNGGNSLWLTSFAKPGALLSQTQNPTNFNLPVRYVTAKMSSDTIGAFFVDQASRNNRQHPEDDPQFHAKGGR